MLVEGILGTILGGEGLWWRRGGGEVLMWDEIELGAMASLRLGGIQAVVLAA